MKTNKLIILCLLLSAAFLLNSQEWNFNLNLSHSTPGVMEVFPYPVPEIVSFSTLMGARNSASIGFGVGPSFTDHYYFLIPEKEAAFSWFTGVDWSSRPDVIQTWAQNADPARELHTNENFLDFYTDVRLTQVLLGDRYHDKANISVTLEHSTRFALPLDSDSATEAFFLHQPGISLNIEAADDPFWSVLAFSTTLAATMEMGHTLQNNSFWAFLGTNGQLNARLPIILKYLYVELDTVVQAVPVNLRSQSELPLFSYSGYESLYTGEAQLNLKSRVWEFELMLPMALELGAFVSAEYSSNDITADSFLQTPLYVGGYGELKVEIPNVTAVAIQAGVIYSFKTDDFGFYFKI